MTFDELMTGWNWKPIRNCPGRYTLSSVPSDLAPEDLLGPGVQLREFQVEGARDKVVVAQLNGGGVISYRRADGSHLHTLNTPEGFGRKLRQLGIILNEQ